MAKLPNWSQTGDKISRTVTCGNFDEALKLMNDIGDIANSFGHHPDMSVFNWKNVKIELYTFKCNGLTDDDMTLARLIDDYRP